MRGDIRMFFKRKNEPSLKTFLDELVCADNAVMIDKTNPIRVHLTFIVEEAKWATVQYLYEKKDIIDECFFIADDINGFIMKGVFIEKILYRENLKYLEFHISCKTSEQCQYQTELEKLKKDFPDGHILTCKEFYDNKGLFQKYGFSWEYKDGSMILHHPKV